MTCVGHAVLRCVRDRRAGSAVPPHPRDLTGAPVPLPPHLGGRCERVRRSLRTAQARQRRELAPRRWAVGARVQHPADQGAGADCRCRAVRRAAAADREAHSRADQGADRRAALRGALHIEPGVRPQGRAARCSPPERRVKPGQRRFPAAPKSGHQRQPPAHPHLQKPSPTLHPLTSQAPTAPRQPSSPRPPPRPPPARRAEIPG